MEELEMASIVIKGENNERYELEYNLFAIAKMEENGFDISNMEKKPISTLLGLIKGAFIMHQPTMTDDEVKEVVARIGNNEKLVEELTKMYMDALSFLNNGKSSDNSKNLVWEKH